jgi:ABC-type sulfate/molybdate transport systems ATPase subunit
VSPRTGLVAEVAVRRGAFAVDVALTVAPGEVLALVGPNGAGKSTVLRALAGLEPLAAGRLELDGRVLDDPGGGAWVPPARRGVGMVFQEYLLFPHLDVLGNVAFGPRALGAGRRDAERVAAGWLDRVGLGDRARDRPSALSGGQAQRVALARALAADPGLLLLDEPLAALDAGTRVEVRARLRGHLAGYAGATVLVTHDPVDALVLADRLVVVEDGRAVQAGTPAEVARAPRTEYVAGLVGLNLYRGTAEGHDVHLDGGGVLHAVRSAAGAVLVTVPPAAVALFTQRPTGTPRNTWPGRVEALEARGDTVRVRVSGPPGVLADVTAEAVAETGLVPGAPVWVAVKATEVAVHPA